MPSKSTEKEYLFRRMCAYAVRINVSHSIDLCMCVHRLSLLTYTLTHRYNCDLIWWLMSGASSAHFLARAKRNDNKLLYT